MSRTRILSLFLALAIGAPAAAQDAAPDPVAGLEDGLYAVIKTNKGTMIASLDYDKVPHTVGNFVGLAEGSLAWTDEKTKEKKEGKPFYNGLTFHRIIKGFMIQGGCPLGNGMGGPGYSFHEEFHPTLRHSGKGILSMAKTRAPNTTGSQFFITLGPTPHLDNKHSVFGKLVKGTEVLEAIGGVKTKGPGGQPEEAVTIESITIHRVGDAAKAWKVEEVGKKDVPAAAGEADPSKVWQPKGQPAIQPNKQGFYRMMLVRHKDSIGASPLVRYTKDEAKALAEKIVALARVKDADFEKIAAQYSDLDASAPVPLPNTPQLPPVLKPILTLSGSQVSDPIDWRDGWLILTPAEFISARHILISFKGSPVPGVTRSKDEAKALAEDLLAKLKAGASWDELVAQSDDKGTPGGQLPNFTREMMVKPFSDAAFKLKVDALCETVVESKFGFHVIQRTR